MAGVVFADPEARHALEGIIHPFVREETERWFQTLTSAQHPYAIADIPLLFEGGRNIDFDKVIVVACEPDAQLHRLMARDNLSEQEARQRIAAQWPLADKVAKADYVIRTDGTFDDTNRQVDELHEQLTTNH